MCLAGRAAGDPRHWQRLPADVSCHAANAAFVLGTSSPGSRRQHAARLCFQLWACSPSSRQQRRWQQQPQRQHAGCTSAQLPCRRHVCTSAEARDAEPARLPLPPWLPAGRPGAGLPCPGFPQPRRLRFSTQVRQRQSSTSALAVLGQEESSGAKLSCYHPFNHVAALPTPPCSAA